MQQPSQGDPKDHSNPNSLGSEHATPPRRQRVLRYESGEVEPDPLTILKKLFDRVVQECNVHPARWKRLCDTYISQMEHDRGTPMPNVVEARASINKNFGSMASMTFKNLLKGFLFLRCVKCEVTVKLHHNSGAITEHGVWFPIAKQTKFEEGIDYDPRTPIESTDDAAYFTRPAGWASPPAPPPDLSKFAGEYPPVRPESLDPGSDA